MSLDLVVAKLMSPNPITVPVQARLSGVRAIMFKHNLHHVPVVDGKRLIGMVSTSDLLRHGPSDLFASPSMVDRALDQNAVEAVMTKDLVTITPEEPIRRAVELLLRGTLHSLPVVDGTDLVGIITTTDLLKHLAAALDQRAREL